MTIQKNQEWGSSQVVPSQVVYCSSDSALSQSFADGHRDFVLSNGEMFTTLGEPDIKSIGDQAIRLPIDMMKIEIFTRANSRIQYFAASHVSSGHWLSHDFVVITNTGRCGSYDIAPRAHPNDGTLDMMKLNTEMKLQQRVLARHRARTGTHVPHPSINVSRHSTIDLVRHKRARLCLDGVDIKDWKSASITVLADACYIYV